MVRSGLVESSALAKRCSYPLWASMKAEECAKSAPQGSKDGGMKRQERADKEKVLGTKERDEEKQGSKSSKRAMFLLFFF